MNTELKNTILNVIECSEIEKHTNTSEATPVFSYRICTPKFTLEISRQGRRYTVMVNQERLLNTTLSHLRPAEHLMALEIWEAIRNKYEQQVSHNQTEQNTLKLLQDYIATQNKQRVMVTEPDKMR